MSSFMQNPTNVERRWYILDATGKPLGRVATVAANILRGKYKVTFTPHVDCGDHCIILNCEKAILTGKKLEQKSYYRHTGHVGGIKMRKAGEMMVKKPEWVVETAVKGMLPNTTIGRKALTRLRAVKGSEHNHAAQKPELWSGEIK